MNKITSHFSLRIVAILFLFSLSINAAYSKPSGPKSTTDSLNCLKISGRITLGKKLIKGRYKAELISYNTVLDSAIIKDNSSFTFLLSKNSSYLIKISKKGHMPRFISVCTKMNGTAKSGIQTLFFETELTDAKEARRLDAEALELPVAIITFNKKTKAFDTNEAYTAFVKQKIYGN
jgi:hypothetical protein